MRKRRALRLGLGLGLAGALAASVVALAPSDGDRPAGVPTVVVEETSFRRDVPAEGTLKAVDTTPITAPQNARMPLKVAWLVEDGARVKPGDVVIRFDPTEMKELLRTGHESSEQATSRIAKERVMSRSARRQRDRQAAVAELELEAAREFEAADETIFSRHEIIESQIDRDLAGARLKHAREVKNIERSASSGKLEVLDVQKRQAQLQVDRAEGALAHTELAAPHAGIVLLRHDWQGKVLQVGDTVWPGQKLAEVSADAAMEAEVFVLEADGGHLADGMKATVAIESAPGRRFAGKVSRVDTLAKPKNPKVPVQYFAVIVELDRTDPEVMKIGQRVRATIAMGETNALVVPRQAVFTRGAESFVYRREGEGFEAVPVTLGASSPGRVVVSEGLAAGDEIALRDPNKSSSDGERREDGDDGPR